MTDSNTVKTRLLKYIEYTGKGQRKFEERCGLSNGYVNNIRVSITPQKLQQIALHCPDLNTGWLMTGEGEMLKSESAEIEAVGSKKRIPFYDDITTIGGYNDSIANVEHIGPVAEWIDTGDWFHEATAAIRHYGDSMVEYPSGSILVLKRVNDPRLIINGRNYVVETTEYRITKQLQDDGADYILAYSSNRDTYPDGRQIHSPIRIPKDSIRHIDLVLGCVLKEYSTGSITIKR